MALAVILQLLLLLPDGVKYYLGPKRVKSGHSSFLPYSAAVNAFITELYLSHYRFGRRKVITEWKASRSFQKHHQRPWTWASTIYVQSNTILLHLFLLHPFSTYQGNFRGLFIQNRPVATANEFLLFHHSAVRLKVRDARVYEKAKCAQINMGLCILIFTFDFLCRCVCVCASAGVCVCVVRMCKY